MKIKPGMRVRVCDGSGLDSRKTGVVMTQAEFRREVGARQTGGGMIPNIVGHYKPMDWSREVPICLDEGEYVPEFGRYITMFKDRLIPLL